MNVLDILGPWKYVAYAAVAAALLGGATYTAHRYNDALREEGRQETRAADEAAAEAQTTSNRELGRLAELHLHALATPQSKFLARATKEIHDAASPLAACPVPESVRVRLNAAAACARGDSTTACGHGD